MKRLIASVLTFVLAAGCCLNTPATEVQNLTGTQSTDHTYRLVISDCSWTQAYQEAVNAGGYLARLETWEEYQSVLQMINNSGVSGIMFRIGARRDPESALYQWVDRNNTVFGGALNAPESWVYPEWMSGEPSFQDGDIQEAYVDIYYYQKEGRWVWDDVPDDIISVVPSYSGKLGYIIEFEPGEVLANPSSLLSSVPDEFYFSSGAGAWSTELTLFDNGAFKGSFHDADMGSDTENYPGGTMYTCEFTGRFTDFRKIDDYTWTMRLDTLSYVHAKDEEWASGGVHYIATDAYGISGGDQFYLYLKGHPTSTLPEGYLSWARMYMGVYGDEMPAELNIYGIYNVAEENGFGSSQ